jgi:MoaA/NifB/PqqE/SkfB family radical SAM enzyme
MYTLKELQLKQKELQLKQKELLKQQKELLKQQKEIAKQIEELKENEKKNKKKKWQPKKDEVYYFIDGGGDIKKCEYSESYYDEKWRVSQGNCFQTKEQAKQHLENLKTKAELRALADELNGDRVINWNDHRQDKHYIMLNEKTGTIDYNVYSILRVPSVIYCLDENFDKKAVQRIGEQRLINMIKSGV